MSPCVFIICLTPGCITAEELKFVMNHLPGKVGQIHLVLLCNHILYSFQVPFDEIDDMIAIVDRNKDGKISYSEFR